MLSDWQRGASRFETVHYRRTEYDDCATFLRGRRKNRNARYRETRRRYGIVDRFYGTGESRKPRRATGFRDAAGGFLLGAASLEFTSHSLLDARSKRWKNRILRASGSISRGALIARRDSNEHKPRNARCVRLRYFI